MKGLKIVLLIPFIALLLVGCNKNNDLKDSDTIINKDYEDNAKDNKVDSKDEKTVENKIENKTEDKIRTMTLEEKIGQLIIAGFEGPTISTHTIDLINKYKIGGFILFARNIENKEQTLKLLNDLKIENSNNNIPLFLSIDEEGGKVSRIPKSYIKIPEAMEFGNKNDVEISYNLGQILGKRVKSLGFNINFAPVLDIYSNPKNEVIGKRAYGNSAENVTNNGMEVMKGIRSMGIIPAVKHFPGHGDTSLDSHIDLPSVNKTLEELESLELIPFNKAIREQVEIIMVAHILYSKLDKQFPASMSVNIIEELLRRKMGYKGVIASDDMTMGAITKNYGLEYGVLEFIKSGGDLALICHGNENPVLAINTLMEAVNQGKISEKEIDEKVYRILKLKEKFRLEDKATKKIDLEDLNKETKVLIEKISN